MPASPAAALHALVLLGSALLSRDPHCCTSSGAAHHHTEHGLVSSRTWIHTRHLCSMLVSSAFATEKPHSVDWMQKPAVSLLWFFGIQSPKAHSNV